MRQFYLVFKKSQALPGQLTWSHIIELLRLDSKEEINYYIYITEKENLSYRKLNERIKSNEYIGQVTKYMNYIDKNIKKITNDKTIGIIICKRENKYVMEYSSDDRIYTTTYKLKELI